MEFTQIPEFILWAKKHILLSLASLILAGSIYAGYQFIGSYASKYGETAAGEYNSFKHTVSNYVAIDSLLSQHLIQYKISRIGIARFHDNVKDVGSNRLFFVSVESMVTAPGVTIDLADLKGLSVSIYSSLLPTMIEGKPFFGLYSDVANNSLKEILKKRGVKAVMYIPINDLNDRLVGMLTIDWINETDIPTEKERAAMAQVFSSIADKIGAYLSDRK